MTEEESRPPFAEDLDPEVEKRLRAIMLAMAGVFPVSRIADDLGLSRESYYKLQRRVLDAAREALKPRKPGPSGQPPNPEKDLLEKELKEARKENRSLQSQLDMAKRLLVKKGKSPDDPDPTPPAPAPGKQKAKKGRGPKGNRFPEDEKREALENLDAQSSEGDTQDKFCLVTGYRRQTLYRWKKAQEEVSLRLLEPLEPPSPVNHRPAGNRTPEERRELFRAFALLKRGTYGAEALKMAMEAPESLSTIKRILREQEQAQEQDQEPSWPLHEVIWTRVNACQAIDFLHLGPLGHWGRMVTVQEAYSRYKPLWEVRQSWDRELVGPQLDRFLKEAWSLMGVPLFLKYDLGPEFRNQEFQRFLENFQVIGLPSPARRPSYNGQEERGNRFIRAWSRPVETANQRERLPEILTEAILDLNYQRPLAVLDVQTPYESFSDGPGIDHIDRKGLLQRVQELVKLFDTEQASGRKNDAPGWLRNEANHVTGLKLLPEIGEIRGSNRTRLSHDPYRSQRKAAKVAAQEYGLLQIRPTELCQPISA